MCLLPGCDDGWEQGPRMTPAPFPEAAHDSETVRSRSRTRRLSSASAITFAVCWPRNDPPSTRDKLSTAWLPHARQAGVLFSLINSHCTQKTALCKARKLISCNLTQPMWRNCLRQKEKNQKAKWRRDAVKVS